MSVTASQRSIYVLFDGFIEGVRLQSVIDEAVYFFF